MGVARTWSMGKITSTITLCYELSPKVDQEFIIKVTDCGCTFATAQPSNQSGNYCGKLEHERLIRLGVES